MRRGIWIGILALSIWLFTSVLLAWLDTTPPTAYFVKLSPGGVGGTGYEDRAMYPATWDSPLIIYGTAKEADIADSSGLDWYKVEYSRDLNVDGVSGDTDWVLIYQGNGEVENDSMATFSPPTRGWYFIRVYAKDLAGNYSADPADTVLTPEGGGSFSDTQVIYFLWAHSPPTPDTGGL